MTGENADEKLEKRLGELGMPTEFPNDFPAEGIEIYRIYHDVIDNGGFPGGDLETAFHSAARLKVALSDASFDAESLLIKTERETIKRFNIETRQFLPEKPQD